MTGNALAVTIASASLAGAFVVACSHLTRDDGSGKSRLIEWHHSYIGLGLAALASVMGWPSWVEWVGLAIFAEDVAVHCYQMRFAMDAGDPNAYPRDWEIGLLHRLYTPFFNMVRR